MDSLMVFIFILLLAFLRVGLPVLLLLLLGTVVDQKFKSAR